MFEYGCHDYSNTCRNGINMKIYEVSSITCIEYRVPLACLQKNKMSHRLACYSPSFRIPRKPQKPSQQLRKNSSCFSRPKRFHRCYCCSILHCRRLTLQICPINHLVIHPYYASSCCCCCCKKGSQIGNLVSNQVITAGHNE